MDQGGQDLGGQDLGWTGGRFWCPDANFRGQKAGSGPGRFLHARFASLGRIELSRLRRSTINWQRIDWQETGLVQVARLPERPVGNSTVGVDRPGCDANANGGFQGIVAQVLAWKNRGSSFDQAEMSAEPAIAPVSRHAVTFIMITVFLDMMGFGIIFPVLPKLIGGAARVDLAAARIGGGLAAVFWLGQFLFAPRLGNTSDRFGRRPLLLLAIGGLLGENGARVPFLAAAAGSWVNLIYGYFVLPETLTLANRRPFDWRRSNPFAALRVFSTYPGVLPLCACLFSFFFFTSIYPAIWPFWGKANFGWPEATIGLSLAAFGSIGAVVQGTLSGPFVKWFCETRTLLVGLATSRLAASGDGLAESLPVVVGLMVVHRPEGFVYPAATAIMSKRVPENAQGELQGGLSAITNFAMPVGTVFYAQLFGWFMRKAAPFRSPNVPFFVAGRARC